MPIGVGCVTKFEMLFQFYFRMGTMHVVATNIILWIRTLIKESLEEIEEFEIEEIEKMKIEKMEVCIWIISYT